MKKKALESKLKPVKQMSSSILNKLGKYIKDEDDVDYYDPVTHAICAETLAAEYKKEKQIKLLEEFERKNTKLRDQTSSGNNKLELKEDIRCLRIYEKEEAQFGKIYRRNQEKVLKRFDRVMNAA